MRRLCTVSLHLYVMLLKTIFPGCGVRASLIYFDISPTFFIDHGGTVVTYLPPTSEVGISNRRPYVGKLVVAYLWLPVYSTENDQLNVLISSTPKLDMNCTVLKVT